MTNLHSDRLRNRTTKDERLSIGNRSIRLRAKKTIEQAIIVVCRLNETNHWMATKQTKQNDDDNT